MIEWTISQELRLVRAHVVGRATPEHFTAYLAALTDAGAAPYRKLFSIVGDASVAAEDIPAIAALVLRFARGAARVGPLAIVVSNQQGNALADWFRSLASVERPVRVFQSEATAMAWLDGIAPP